MGFFGLFKKKNQSQETIVKEKETLDKVLEKTK